MIYDVTTLLAGLLLLFLGAEGLVRGAVALSLRLGVPPLLVGLTVLGFSTSSPELVVSLKASLQGNGAISLGNVIGSNIANTGLILGLAAIIFPLIVQRQIIRREIPVMLAMTFVGGWFILGPEIGRVEGFILFSGLIGYVVYSIYSARQSGESAPPEEVESVAVNLGKHWGIDVALLIGGLAILLLGAELMVRGAVNIATALGAPQVIIGLSIVAIGTSLPELATSLVAAFKKEGDLMVGNLIGSNIFNLGGILGITTLIQPLATAQVERWDVVILMVFSLSMIPIMKTQNLISRSEGVLLLVGYAGYMAYLATRL